MMSILGLKYIFGQTYVESNTFGVIKYKFQYIWGQITSGSNTFGVKYILGSNVTYPTYLIEREGRDIAQQELQNATLASEGDNLFTMLPQLVMY